MDEFDEGDDTKQPKTWLDKYGVWIVLLVIFVGGIFRVLFLPPLPNKYDWTLGLVVLFVLALVAYFSFRKSRD